MKQVISVKDVEELIRQGGNVKSLPADALLTPSARDMLREMEDGVYQRPIQNGAQNGARQTASTKAVNANSSPAELEAFYNSPEMEEHKQVICDIGRRLWKRAYVDGNGGNIAIRVGPEKDLVLCTPTLISKGFMKPEDMCLVDMEGKQVAGSKKRTSEVLMHLQIMKRQPKALASVHCHPPHATAFAVAGVEPPTCLIPEFEVFCAVATAPYRTPGTPEMGKLIADLVDKHDTILMANHGVVAWSRLGIEDAYWRMEIIEAYCRTVVVASQLGKPLQGFSPGHLQDLLKIKQTLGFVDPRIGLKECELCDNNEWRPGVQCAVPAKNDNCQCGVSDTPPTTPTDPNAEHIVQMVTDMIMERMSKS